MRFDGKRYSHSLKGLNMLSRTAIALTFLALASTGCNQPLTGTAIDQENLCQVDGWQHDVVANTCKPGQKLVFLPQTFGNAQLPVIFAAVNCDLRYSVALTEGAVTCIYQPITPGKKSESDSQSPPANP
jgi:hypothetical protein